MGRMRIGDDNVGLDALVASIEQPMRLGRIVAQAGRPAAAVRRQLVALVQAGRLTHPEYGFFAPAGFQGEVVRHTAPAVVGGFNWSSQHRDGGWCDGGSATFGSGPAG